MSTACLQNPAVTCKNGQICAPGNVCDDAHGGCATSSQIVACSGKAEEAACSYPGVNEGACYEGVCLPAGCGNGVISGVEVCDDGNRIHGDGCSADCLSGEVCGNGVIDSIANETCDDGNTISGDGCQSNCQGPFCGDGIIDSVLHEDCDDGAGNADAADACRTTCRAPRCGDEITDSNEVCDDGNLLADDGCSADCASKETCGNDYVDAVKGEICDDGNGLRHDGCSSCQSEDATWKQMLQTVPSARRSFAMAYDAARGRVVLFGGINGTTLRSDTWEWNGVAWLNVTPATGNPPARSEHAMAYDASRSRIVMFGGNGGSVYLSDTWEWNGSSWAQVTPPSGSPRARHAHAMAYDSARKRVVLFGGNFGNTGSTPPAADTWEWNGSTWQAMGGGPTMRQDHAMTYDAARGQIVLFGGNSGSARLDDTWTWDGATWIKRAPTSKPTAREKHAMTYDAARSRVLLVAGNDGAQQADAWEWDGATWAKAAPATSPAVRESHALAYDIGRGRTVLFGGSSASSTMADTWEWSGTSWGSGAVTPAATAPPPRSGAGMAYDAARGRTVIFGGGIPEDLTSFNDCWEWDGTSWRQGPGGPQQRSNAAFAYDSKRRRVVMFGGFSNDGESTSDLVGAALHYAANPDTAFHLNDTWEYDGTTWMNKTPAAGSPGRRGGAAMTFDAKRGRIVMFGGAKATPKFSGTFRLEYTYFNDTWEWDGTAWTQAATTDQPAAGMYAGFTYDAAREIATLFSGSTTWDWDGMAWKQAGSSAEYPAFRTSETLAYDPLRMRSVVFGGFQQSNGPHLADLWESDGAEWVYVPTATSPPPREQHSMVYDAARSRMVMFGGFVAGSTGKSSFNDTWTFRYQNGAADDGCLYGLDGDDDGLVACADPDCAGVCAYINDGVCESIETKRLAPSDCGIATARCGNFLCEPAETSASCPGDCM